MVFGGGLAGAWWLIPLSKWVITPVISGLTLLIPFITGVITQLRAVGHHAPRKNLPRKNMAMVGQRISPGTPGTTDFMILGFVLTIN